MIRVEHLREGVPPIPATAVVVPRRAEEIARPADRFGADERTALARQIEEQLAQRTPHVAVIDAVRSLSEPGACAVVTGQQPGLLAAPLYSLYKALHAIALARHLRRLWSTPVVALFWNHADDHDIAEVHHANLVNRNLDVQKITLAGVSSGRQPFSRIVLDEPTHHLAAIRALLAQIVEGTPFAERAVDLFAARPGETLASAFTRSLTDLLGRAGLVVLEPDWIRPQMSAHLARLAACDPLGALEKGAARLKAQGQEPAIEPAGAALFYLLDTNGRRALRAGGDGFRFDGEAGSRTGPELAAEIVQDPAAWSPGALLRPVVQDLCLPVAAYVGGMGELAYHVELPELRASVGAPATPFVPRVSCTLVDPECRVSLGRVGTTVAEILRARGVGEPEGDGAQGASTEPAVIARMRAIADAGARELEALRDDLAALDAGLLSQLKRAAGQMRSAGEWVAEKAERVHQNKSGKGRRHLRRLASSLFPLGEPQERILGPLPFVARFGEDWPIELLKSIDPFAPEHLVVNLGSDLEGDAT
ncbi:MAG TPA: bacillithiol biosynthesis cysteine-adding enzyme BshC [Planctomycetota bacterium]|jgi:bacillithiol biosynthesis cysteine-adding enzyme BshC|nr:bacillithiol biosynthesis cysteine-adding enzyme BshC [Planctomycetota bacterium]